MKKETFTLITLDGAKIVKRKKETDLIKGADDNYHLKFTFDLLNGDADIIQGQNEYASNALFWQILRVLPNATSNKDDLRHSLIFIDFAQLSTEDFAFSPKTALSKHDLLEDVPTRVGEIFSRGLDLSFDGITTKHFVAFDKSSSMAKKSVISFLSADLKNSLDKRLMLAIDLSDVPVVLSKYYAYRGLYLSSGIRMQSFAETDDALSLNEETVIVLPDFRTTIVQDIIGAERKDDLWKCVETPNKIISLNCFDGEGLISPTWSAQLNAQLKNKCFAHSFQVRLPFTKGVLHEVNFVKFFREELNCSARELWVKDIFGIKRDLLTAKIILTASMFKCGDWLKEWSSRPADPMKYFFEKMKLYEHALWICNTDANLNNTGKVSLNGQFLSTLDLLPQDCDSLVTEHIERIQKMSQSVKNILQNAKQKKCDEDISEDEDAFTQTDTVRDKCLKLLKHNSAFLDDPKVKTIIDIMQSDLEKALCLGRLSVQGEVRFLSCDLLYFLLCLADKCGIASNKLTDLRTQILFSEHFYMPEKILTMKCDKYYAFLRSPHLSRNEQCLLRPLVKSGNFYEKYFSHLTGVVMVSAKSSVPMALGGADFDGDLVKVISDKKIVEAVLRGVYVKDKNSLTRKLPVIKIPSIKAVSCKIPPSIPLKVIQDTFANQVGRISNQAIRIAQLEYADNSEDTKGKCAECTIVVGLEIDSAKSGIHPDKNIEHLKSFKASSLFLDASRFFERRIWTTFYSPHVVRSAEKGCFELYLLKRLIGKKKPSLSMPLNAEGLPFLEQLPIRYLSYLYDKAEKKSADKATRIKEHKVYFKFEQEKSWQKRDARTDKLKELVQAFVAVRRLIKRAEQWQEWLEERDCVFFMGVELDIQYDSPDKMLPCGVTVAEATKQISEVFACALTTIDEVARALKLMREKKWHFQNSVERAKLLAEILNCRPEEIMPSVLYVLSNFRDNGFMLLCYVLTNLQIELEENADLCDFIASKEKLDGLRLSKNFYWEKLYNEYLTATKEKVSKSVRDERLAKICREYVKEIFDDNFEDALRHFWIIRSEDPARNFFWRVFTTKELLDNVYEKGDEKSC